MRVRALLFSALFFVGAQAQSDTLSWESALEVYWSKIDSAYADSLHSPLPIAEREAFTTLERFPLDPDFRVTARFEAAPGAVFGMKTSTEREPKYQKVGVLHFVLQGLPFELTVYKNIDLSKLEDYTNYLFVPFTDLSNGDETYGGGRYIDLEGPLGEQVELDLNKAYNPYCAYGGSYSCPIPPEENHLEVAVRAGVKKYH